MGCNCITGSSGGDVAVSIGGGGGSSIVDYGFNKPAVISETQQAPEVRAVAAEASVPAIVWVVLGVLIAVFLSKVT